MQRYEHGGDIYANEKILLDFSVNTNPMGLPESVKKALAGSEEIYTRYPDTKCRALRGALAEHHGVLPENVLCGNGAADMIFRICAWKKAKNVLMLAPTFSEYERSVGIFGGRVSEYPLSEENGFVLTEDFAEHITDTTDMVFLCTPNNPTGRLISPNVLEKVLQRCIETDTLLVLDECFIEFTFGKSMAGYAADYPQLLILRAFTKLYSMAGLRLGYLLGAAEILNEISVYGAEWSVSGPAQAAGIAALSAEPEWAALSRETARRERIFMVESIETLGIEVIPSDANFMLLRSELPLHERLKERGILTRRCANFSGLDDKYIRIALKSREENEMLIKVLREVTNG